MKYRENENTAYHKYHSKAILFSMVYWFAFDFIWKQPNPTDFPIKLYISFNGTIIILLFEIASYVNAMCQRPPIFVVSHLLFEFNYYTGTRRISLREMAYFTNLLRLHIVLSISPRSCYGLAVLSVKILPQIYFCIMDHKLQRTFIGGDQLYFHVL